MPLISVILPTCDRPALLPRAATSVLAQTEVDFELLIVDQNRAAPRVDPAAWSHDARVRIVDGSRSAPNASGARNAGLMVARGEWIAFLDDDDAYRPAKLASQLAAASAAGTSIALCGGEFHLRGRTRLRGPVNSELKGDELLFADLGAPFVLHRRRPALRFDDTLSTGEDLLYGQALLAEFSVYALPCVPQPLVDVYQDEPARERTNRRPGAGWQAARRTLIQFGARYSPRARRLFLLRALITRAKLERRATRCLAMAPALLRAGGSGQLRFAANAALVASGIGRGRWVT